MTTSRKYPSSLSDEQWQIIRRLLPRPNERGRKPIDRRWIIDAILYWNRTGCQWRYLPTDFPNWNTVYGVFRQWRLDGTWKRIHDRLREMVRKAADEIRQITNLVIGFIQRVRCRSIAQRDAVPFLYYLHVDLPIAYGLPPSSVLPTFPC